MKSALLLLVVNSITIICLGCGGGASEDGAVGTEEQAEEEPDCGECDEALEDCMDAEFACEDAEDPCRFGLTLRECDEAEADRLCNDAERLCSDATDICDETGCD